MPHLPFVIDWSLRPRSLWLLPGPIVVGGLLADVATAVAVRTTTRSSTIAFRNRSWCTRQTTRTSPLRAVADRDSTDQPTDRLLGAIVPSEALDSGTSR